MAHFRRPVALSNHLQTDTTVDHSHHLLPRISECQSGVSLDQHGLLYGSFPADGAVHGYIMPPSGSCGANQPSLQAPPPHHMAVLTPTMILPARCRHAGPSTTPNAPTRPQTTMEEMGECSPILLFLIKSMTTSYSRFCSAWIRLFATGIAATTTIGG